MKLKVNMLLFLMLFLTSIGIISLLFPSASRSVYSSPDSANNLFVSQNLSKNDFISNQIIKMKSNQVKKMPDISAVSKVSVVSPEVSISGKSVLVLYDSFGDFGWMGDLYSVQLTNMISHFDITTVRKPVESYQQNDYQNYDFIIYYGALYDSPLPQALKDDILITTKPFMWIGYNLWKVAVAPDWSSYNAAFETKFGVRYRGIDITGYPNIN